MHGRVLAGPGRGDVGSEVPLWGPLLRASREVGSSDRELLMKEAVAMRGGQVTSAIESKATYADEASADAPGAASWPVRRRAAPSVGRHRARTRASCLYRAGTRLLRDGRGLGAHTKVIAVRARLVRVGLGAFLVAGCGLLGPSLPSEAEARSHLARIVSVVTSGNLSALCELASATCDIDLRNIELAKVPKAGPLTVSGSVIPTTKNADGSQNVGGYLLQLCGVDGTGATYHSEMLVFRDGDRLRAINAFYWLGATIARSPVTGGPPLPSGPCFASG